MQDFNPPSKAMDHGYQSDSLTAEPQWKLQYFSILFKLLHVENISIFKASWRDGGINFGRGWPRNSQLLSPAASLGGPLGCTSGAPSAPAWLGKCVCLHQVGRLCWQKLQGGDTGWHDVPEMGSLALVSPPAIDYLWASHFTSQTLKSGKTGVPAVTQWVKNLTAVARVAVEVRVQSLARGSWLKNVALLQRQLRFSPWARNFHMPQAWPVKKKKWENNNTYFLRLWELRRKCGTQKHFVC